MPTELVTSARTAHEAPGFRVTGRFVLVSLLLFFGTIIAMNVVMAKLAISTFGGLETASSYKAGLAFAVESRAARAQDAMHWSVDAGLQRDANGRAVLRVDARDRNGAPLSDLVLAADLRHPTKASEDRSVAMHEIDPGIYEGSVPSRAGQWQLRLDLSRGGERLFRSETRLILK